MFKMARSRNSKITALSCSGSYNPTKTHDLIRNLFIYLYSEDNRYCDVRHKYGIFGPWSLNSGTLISGVLGRHCDVDFLVDKYRVRGSLDASKLSSI